MLKARTRKRNHEGASNAGLEREGSITTEYIVGLRREGRSEVLTIEAEDALIAALRVKHDHP